MKCGDRVVARAQLTEHDESGVYVHAEIGDQGVVVGTTEAGTVMVRFRLTCECDPTEIAISAERRQEPRASLG